jgi:cytoskeletal protein RodZ
MEPRDMSVPFPQDTGPSSRVYLLLSMLIIVAVVVVLAEWFIRSQRGNLEETGLPPVAAEPDAKAARATHATEAVPAAVAPGETPPPRAAAATETTTMPSQPSPDTQSEPPPGAPAPQASAVAIAPTGESMQAGGSTPVAGQTVSNGVNPMPMDGHGSTQTAPLKPGQSRLTFNFDLESWVEVKDADGEVLYSALNQSGTEKSIVGTAPFSVVIGNASGVRLTYKGEPVTLKPHRSSDVARLTLE